MKIKGIEVKEWADHQDFERADYSYGCDKDDQNENNPCGKCTMCCEICMYYEQFEETEEQKLNEFGKLVEDAEKFIAETDSAELAYKVYAAMMEEMDKKRVETHPSKMSDEIGHWMWGWEGPEGLYEEYEQKLTKGREIVKKCSIK